MFVDATRAAILHAAGLERAKVIVATLDSLSGSERLVHCVRHMGLTIPVIIRTHDMASAKGVCGGWRNSRPSDNLAAGLGLSEHLLRVLGVAPQEIVDRIEHVRSILRPRREWARSAQDQDRSGPIDSRPSERQSKLAKEGSRFLVRPGQGRWAHRDPGRRRAPEAAGYGQGWPHRIPASY